MQMLSTRGAAAVSPSQAILRGLAPDGGLYVPAEFPQFTREEIMALAPLSYQARALAVLSRFLPDFTEEELAALEPYLIYAQVEGEPDRWPMAVDITHLPFVQDTMAQEEQVFFTLSGNVRSEDACRSIWEYINNWGK